MRPFWTGLLSDSLPAIYRTRCFWQPCLFVHYYCWYVLYHVLNTLLLYFFLCWCQYKPEIQYMAWSTVMELTSMLPVVFLRWSLGAVRGSFLERQYLLVPQIWHVLNFEHSCSTLLQSIMGTHITWLPRTVTILLMKSVCNSLGNLYLDGLIDLHV